MVKLRVLGSYWTLLPKKSEYSPPPYLHPEGLLLPGLKTHDVLTYISLCLVTKSLPDLFIILGIIASPIIVDPFPVVSIALSSVISDVFLVLVGIPFCSYSGTLWRFPATLCRFSATPFSFSATMCGFSATLCGFSAEPAPTILTVV